ncbi:disease resistance protein RUN1 isoform X4 [Rosa chinensis]|uniref:disease resistance protein RUN1 isoform X4 n=1 Tax=Rosa chinensis TaxID=74649 RepID=UPI001AD9111F|nr:disease resistance protein RUN1 isoform X4 [Rosa chinensis]
MQKHSRKATFNCSSKAKNEKQNMASLTNEAASSSSSSLPHSSTDHQNHYTYEVFLSFRGEDTRFNFTDHLHTALCQKGIETFRDDKLSRGEDISQELLKAIEESRVSIIVFSQNYASSRWCLDELVKILECRKSRGHEVRPVFYKVDPSDVRHQRGAFGEAFATLDQCKYKDSIGKWKATLKEAADLSGWPIKDGEYEGKFIRKIVGELSARVVNPSCMLQIATHPIGIESCRQDVNRLLHAKENIVCMVGIWGPGGIGKTTIAKAVFNSIRHNFEGSCFLEDVRSNGLAPLQERLLFDIFRDSTLKVCNVDQGVNFIKTWMRKKKVLVVLDDVSHSSQLQNLVPSHDCFSPGSRILITTRDKRWLIAHQVDEVYEVKMLNDRQALNLFSLNAFKRNDPPGDYLELAQRVVRYAQGLPLALIVLGSHLFLKSRDEWEATLDGCKGEDPHIEIINVLKISYDALGVDLKGYFLDIACFFKGKYVDNVKPILEACYDLKSLIGIAQLKQKALIRIDYETFKGGRIWMHDLIEEMGKEIVRQEGESSGRSRLWKYDDVDHVLTDNMGTKKIKGIEVEGQLGKTICLNAKSFSEMKNLRYFVSDYFAHYSGNIDYLSNELRWLNWSGCPIQSFPSNFHPRKLVALHIPYSRFIRRLWEGLKNFPILTSMDLRCCKSLTELPNFTGIPNLKELNLYGCESLVVVHQSVGFLDKLVTLSLEGCYKLVKLPTEISLKSLIAMDLSDCRRLEEFPKIIGKIDSFKKLNLSHTSIKELHSSIGNLMGLNELNLADCKNLTTIPCSIYELQNVEILDVSGCSNLVTFPTKASISYDHDSGSLALPKLRALRINRCNLSTADFIGSLGCFETLTELDLSSNNFVSVPALGKFVNLPRIDLYCCKRLREIPELPPNILKVNARDCESLERFLILPKSLKMLEMNLWNCHRFSYSLCYDMVENILLNNQHNTRFGLVLPDSEVPKWFHCSKEVAANEKGPSSTCAISFEIPSKLNWENIGLAVCSVLERRSFMTRDGVDISINGVFIHRCSDLPSWRRSNWLYPTADHMWLTYFPLSDEIKGKVDQKGWVPIDYYGKYPIELTYQCQVEFYCSAQIKSCGVHLICQPPKEYSNKIVMAAEPAHESGMPMAFPCELMNSMNLEVKVVGEARSTQIDEFGFQRELQNAVSESYITDEARLVDGASMSEPLAQPHSGEEDQDRSTKYVSGSATATTTSQLQTPNAKSRKRKWKNVQASGPSSPSPSVLNSIEPSNEAGGSSSPPSGEAAFPQIMAMQDMMNQLMTVQKELQKQMTMMVPVLITNEGKRLESALSRSTEKAVKANNIALRALSQEENAKNEKLLRDRTQQVTGLIVNKDFPAMLEKMVKNEIAAVGPAVVRAITPATEKTIPLVISDCFQRGVGDKAVNQLEKSANSKLEATVSRQIEAQFQTSGKQALQDALKSSMEASVVPAFEKSCKAMFEQVDATVQKVMVEHATVAQQHFESAHSPLAHALREAISSASSVTQTLSGELADGQLKNMLKVLV